MYFHDRYFVLFFNLDKHIKGETVYPIPKHVTLVTLKNQYNKYIDLFKVSPSNLYSLFIYAYYLY